MSPQASHSSHQTATPRAARRRASLRAVLLATSALASAAMPITAAHADPVDATWLATQPDDGDPGNFNNADHWTAVPNGAQFPDGTATFNANKIHDITFNDTTTVGGITVTSGAGDYTFDTQGNNVTFTGAGLSVGSGASLEAAPASSSPSAAAPQSSLVEARRARLRSQSPAVRYSSKTAARRTTRRSPSVPAPT